MLRLPEALARVQPHLDAVAASEGTEIVVTSAERVGAAWRIIYNTLDYAEKGDPLDGLLGNVPLEVRDDGSIGEASQMGKLD